MTANQIQFTDGTAYERFMGRWSTLAGDAFTDWLDPAPGLRWLDVGCGTGAFTELLTTRCAPTSVHGIDPSPAQIDFARRRPALRASGFMEGDAMALPYPDDAFDAAVMPLVIFFVPVPIAGVAEMARVVRPGGSVSAYAWDVTGGGFPYHALHAGMRDLGVEVPMPPSPDASRLEVLQALWTEAGLAAVRTRTIDVERTFVDFDDYWSTILGAPSVGPALAAMAADRLALLRSTLQIALAADVEGRITCSARAHAVKGSVPA